MRSFKEHGEKWTTAQSRFVRSLCYIISQKDYFSSSVFMRDSASILPKRMISGLWCMTTGLYWKMSSKRYGIDLSQGKLVFGKYGMFGMKKIPWILLYIFVYNYEK